MFLKKCGSAAVVLGMGTPLIAEESVAALANEVISAEVDWFEEIILGGNTAIALVILFLAMIGFAVERAVRLRRNAIIPVDLSSDVRDLWHQGEFDSISKKCAAQPSILGRMINYLVEHRETEAELLIPGVADIGVRELKAHNQRAFSLAVIAALAPLLGLLGTMIGMIESFKLVEQYGDEGGASMLAGSISKALITTALGLIIAIPSLILYHFFKFRCNHLGNELDEEIEVLINNWLLKKAPAAAKEAVEESSTADSASDSSDSKDADADIDTAAAVPG